MTKERTTIGRKPHNDIQIDNLAVSGEHAVIVTILNDSFLEDLGSTNGTVVNGNPIKKHFLQNNDVIELGKYKLKFIGDAAPVPAGDKADFEKTMVLRPTPKPTAAAATAAVGVQAAVAQRAARCSRRRRAPRLRGSRTRSKPRLRRRRYRRAPRPPCRPPPKTPRPRWRLPPHPLPRRLRRPLPRP